MKLVILAGGSGTRLWPLSRIKTPKQVQPFLDGKTLLEHTWHRLRKGFEARDIFISTTAPQVREIKKQLPELPTGNFIIEPEARNTGPAIALVALILNKLYPGEVVVTVNSDHYIKEEALFNKTLKIGEQTVKKLPNYLVLFGIKPSYPETGYGYIKIGGSTNTSRKEGAYKVVAFIEKPSFKIAEHLATSPKYLWNSGMFMFYPEILLESLKQVTPTFYKLFQKIKLEQRNKQWAVSPSAFNLLPKESIDYLLIEKMKRLVVVPMNASWADVGHFRTIYDIMAQNQFSNVTRGKVISYESKGNLIYSLAGKLVATVGIEGLVIVETKDALLVCRKDQAQDVKKIVQELKKQGLGKYL